MSTLKRDNYFLWQKLNMMNAGYILFCNRSEMNAFPKKIE